MPGLTGISGLTGLSGLVGGGATYDDKVLTYNPTQFLPLSDASGGTAVDLSGNGYNGAYTGVTLNQTVTDAAGVTFVCPRFDGAGDWVAIYSAPLAAVWSFDEFSMCMWIRAFNATVWTTNFLRLFSIWNDANNAMDMLRSDVNGNLRVSREANNVYRAASWDAGSPLTWLHFAFTVSKTANQHRGYQNGVQQGGTQTVPNDYVGALLATAQIGAAAGASVWNGWIAKWAYWAGTILTQPQIAVLADPNP